MAALSCVKQRDISGSVTMSARRNDRGWRSKQRIEYSWSVLLRRMEKHCPRTQCCHARKASHLSIIHHTVKTTQTHLSHVIVGRVDRSPCLRRSRSARMRTQSDGSRLCKPNTAGTLIQAALTSHAQYYGLQISSFLYSARADGKDKAAISLHIHPCLE